MRIMMQYSPGDWNSAFKEVKAEILHFMATGTFSPVNPDHSYKTTFKLLEGDTN